MFTHILLPSDGSPLCESAVRRGIDFAKEANARVTGFHAIPEYKLIPYEGWVPDAETLERFEAAPRTKATEILDRIKAMADEAGVDCRCVSLVSDHPYDAIIQAAEQNGCDLIMMASHGRRGLAGMLLGSETQKVLTHTNIPVLVYR